MSCVLLGVNFNTRVICFMCLCLSVSCYSSVTHMSRPLICVFVFFLVSVSRTPVMAQSHWCLLPLMCIPVCLLVSVSNPATVSSCLCHNLTMFLLVAFPPCLCLSMSLSLPLSVSPCFVKMSVCLMRGTGRS